MYSFRFTTNSIECVMVNGHNVIFTLGNLIFWFPVTVPVGRPREADPPFFRGRMKTLVLFVFMFCCFFGCYSMVSPHETCHLYLIDIPSNDQFVECRETKKIDDKTNNSDTFTMSLWSTTLTISKDFEFCVWTVSLAL